MMVTFMVWPDQPPDDLLYQAAAQISHDEQASQILIKKVSEPLLQVPSAEGILHKQTEEDNVFTAMEVLLILLILMSQTQKVKTYE